MDFKEKYNHNLLIEKIKEHYIGTMKQKMDQFCKDVHISTYRMNNIIKNNSYFLTPEQDRIIRVLNILDEEVVPCFLTKIDF